MQENFYLHTAQENPDPRHGTDRSFGTHRTPRRNRHPEIGYLAPNIFLLLIQMILEATGDLPETRLFGSSGIPLGVLLCLAQVALLLVTTHRFDRAGRHEDAA